MTKPARKVAARKARDTNPKATSKICNAHKFPPPKRCAPTPKISSSCALLTCQHFQALASKTQTEGARLT